MTRVLLFLGLALCFGFSPAHGAPLVEPGALGQQAQATFKAGGELIIKRSITRLIWETKNATETRTRVVEVDGGKREVAYSVQVPIMICKPVTNQLQYNVAAERVQAFDMQGKPVSARELAKALKEETTVLLATRKVPKYYLGIYRADTLQLVVDPMMLAYASTGQGYGVPTPGPMPQPTAPVAPRVEGSLLPVPAPVVVEQSPVSRRAPVAPQPSRAAAPSSPTAASPELKGMEPQVSMARSADSKIGLRTYVKQVNSETSARDIVTEGKKKRVDVAVEVISIVDVERKYPLDAVTIRRADKKPLAGADLAKLLATDRCVLVSTDGEEVDARFLKIIKPDALIVVVPLATPIAPPVAAPPILSGP